MKTAPILLFAYKRLDTLKKTLKALQLNKLASESDLFVFSDGAKFEKDLEIVNQIRSFLRTIDGFKSVTIVESKINKGLANSIIEGVSEVIDKYDQVIVLEDDLITTPNFLQFMNQCLTKYASIGKVFSISGYSFNLGQQVDYNEDVYFLNRGWSWGWATWKDRWETVDWEVKSYSQFNKNKKLKRSFAKGGSDLNKMLENQITGKLDSWAIRWFYHQFYVQGLTVYPVFSKVNNEGFDKDATHTTGSDTRYKPMLDNENKEQFLLLPIAEATPYYQKKFQHKMGITSRIISKMQSIIKKLLSK